jgi:hypothetical protein
MLQVRAPKPDGIGSPEKVEVASAEASTVQYIGLLAATVALGLLFASKAFRDGEVHWPPLLGTLVAGYFTYEGVYYLRLQNYVNTVQRTGSRVSWTGTQCSAVYSVNHSLFCSTAGGSAKCGLLAMVTSGMLPVASINSVEVDASVYDGLALVMDLTATAACCTACCFMYCSHADQ